jgi:LysM repeat protein
VFVRRSLTLAVSLVVAASAVGGLAVDRADAASGERLGGYVIQRNDTLSGLAKRFNTTIDALRKRNRLSDTTLQIGSSLLLDDRGSPKALLSPARPRVVPFPTPTTLAQHTVTPGESLQTVADRFGMSVKSLVALNQLGKARTVRPGQVLSISIGTYPNLPARLRERPERQALMGWFDRSAEEAGVDPALLKALAFVESGWQPDALSDQNAIGVCQLMAPTAAEQAISLGLDAADPWDATVNIRLSAHYLRMLVDKFPGRLPAAVAAYYQGHNAVASKGVSAAGRDYAKAILALRQAFLPVRPTSQP